MQVEHEHIIEKAGNGDKEAFGHLVGQYRQFAFSLELKTRIMLARISSITMNNKN